MNSIKLTDGMEIQAYGEYRITLKSYALYVVRHGMCIPVDDPEDAEELLEALKSKQTRQREYVLQHPFLEEKSCPEKEHFVPM